MIALSMYEEYLIDILTSKRKDDVRLYNTKNRGKIALMKSRTNMIYGYVELISVEKITYEEYIMWHICSTFSKEDAKKYIEINKMLIMNKYAYKYVFGNPILLDAPKKVRVVNTNKSWIEYVEYCEKIKLF